MRTRDGSTHSEEKKKQTPNQNHEAETEPFDLFLTILKHDIHVFPENNQHFLKRFH